VNASAPERATPVRRVLDIAYRLRLHRALSSLYAGCGCIFMLHRVTDPAPAGGFDPNAELSITPGFLRAVLNRLRQLRIDLVSLDEAHRRLREGDTSRYFVCFTCDDGYRDNLEVALPVFREFSAPFAVYVTTGMVMDRNYPWWVALEQVIAGNDRVEPGLPGAADPIELKTDADRYRAFDRLRTAILAMGAESAAEPVGAFCHRHGVDVEAIRAALMLDGEGLVRLAETPEVTIGAHGRTHRPLAGLGEAELDAELDGSRDLLERRLGVEVRHFCYPYGGRAECGPREFDAAARHGYLTATTTRKGNLFPAHRDHLHCLPRVALKGRYQHLRYLDLYLSGLAGALYNRGTRVVTR
jgi:peptidoglycan/xylan/chitin deacetylase (PgdA/CDA1 family)